MRVIAGALGGRRFEAPRDARVRPTADRVREAWFNILGDRVLHATALDLFAGSGALGIEALSRGAARTVFVENARSSLAVLRANIEELDLTGRSEVVRTDAARYAAGLDVGSFDVAFADPPFASSGAERLARIFLQTPFARIFGVEHRAADELAGGDTRTYGDIAVTFFHAS
jgi:16S rRNA (guanine966-N2)-methyltransferase